MKFEFDIEVPEPTSAAIRVKVTCGESDLEIFQIQSEKYSEHHHLCGGGPGDWLPNFDWREEYVDQDKDRRAFALPYRTMLDIAKKRVKDIETSRLIRAAKHEMSAGLS